MAGFILLSAISMGVMMIAGHWLIPDNIVMWFMASTDQMVLWREAILSGLLAMALIRLYFDNRLVRTLWGVAALCLAWYGYQYFLDNTAFIFDSLYMLTAAVSFGIAALQTAEEPQPVLVPLARSLLRRAVATGRVLEAQIATLNQHGTLRMNDWQNVENADHRMTMQHPVHS